MRVLAVTESLLLLELEEELLAQAGLGAHVSGDGHIILGSMGISLCRKLETSLGSSIAVGLELGDYCSIIRRIDEHGD